jgi:hypothetical protein
MERVINDKAEKEKKELKEKTILVLTRILILAFFALEIYFVFKPLMEFMLMIENEMKLTILKYFTG